MQRLSPVRQLLLLLLLCTTIAVEAQWQRSSELQARKQRFEPPVTFKLPTTTKALPTTTRTLPTTTRTLPTTTRALPTTTTTAAKKRSNASGADSGQLIRLRGSNRAGSPHIGRVEVFYRGTWGVVCDDGWNLDAATVVCKMLGYSSGAAAASGGSEFGIGPWSASDIVMTDVTCSGAESSLGHCQFADEHYCSEEEFAGVRCNPNPGCRAGRVAANGACYQLVAEPTTYFGAAKMCQRLGGHLASVETQAVNDALSELLEPSAAAVKAAFVLGQRDVLSGKWNIPHPDLNGGGGSATADSNCLVLSASSNSGSGGTQDYYYKSSRRCDQSLPYICEVGAEAEALADCYTGKGSDYRGTASRTIAGSRCEKWPAADIQSSPGKGLGDHNYCRNPDNDAKPWCWVDKTSNKFGFCDVRECSTTQEQATSIYGQTAAPVQAVTCATNEFACHFSGACVAQSQLCDGLKDCPHEEDERNCASLVMEYRKTAGKRPQATPSASYYNTPIEQCARLCAKSRGYVCKAFVFRKNSDFCAFYTTGSSSAGLMSDADYDLYELKSQMSNCTGSFKCSNQRCIPESLRCNDADDCGDVSDEAECEQSEPVQVRLINNRQGHEHSGMVAVKFRGEWGIICDDNWDVDDARVVCRQLGYVDAMEALTSIDATSSAGSFLLDEVECNGTEASIEQCAHAPWKQHNCLPHEAAGVACQVSKACAVDEFSCKVSKKCLHAALVCDKDDDCGDGSDEQGCNEMSISLEGGAAPNEGRVEITYNGLKGTVCDDEFDDADAQVICRSFGFNGPAVAHRGATKFGPGRGAIWIDDLQCSGAEQNVAACPRSQWGMSDCTHAEDAAVTCSPSAGRPSTPRRPAEATAGRPTPAPATARPTLPVTTTSRGASSASAVCGSRFFRPRRASITGIRYAEPSGTSRVVGGRDAVHGSHPWQVGVKLRNSHWCGGTILNERWILSAAHCFYNRPKSLFTVVTGDFDNTIVEPTEETFELEQIILPEEYRDAHDYDFALLKIQLRNGRGISFSERVQPACLPSSEAFAYPVGMYCHISGWGSIGRGLYPNRLQAAEVPIIDGTTCSTLYKNDITARMFCAGFKEGGIDTCQGDSGGPMVCDINGKFTILGATSFGMGCAQPNAPGVYAKVSSVLPWIYRYIRA